MRTSYPIPPQESFTSPPYSIRYQNPKSADREQYTYLSTKNGAESKITLCKDAISSSGRTASTSKSRRIHHSSPIERLYTSHHLVSGPDAAPYGDLFAVCHDGQILCLDGADLEERWTASTFGLCKDLLPASASAITVDDVFHLTAEEALKGIFQGRQDAFGAFGRAIDPASFNPDIFILVTRVLGTDTPTKCLVVLGAAPRLDANKASTQNLVQLHVAPLPVEPGFSESSRSTYQLHARSARLRELSASSLRTYDLTAAVPKLSDTVIVPEGSCSFVHLSEHCVLSASPAALTITNVTYRSVQAQAAMSIEDKDSPSEMPSANHNLKLLTYLSKLDLAIAVVNNTLYSIQVQRHKSSSREGLLIDAIGCGLSKAEHLPVHSTQRPRAPFNKLLPGSLSDHYVKQSLADVESLDSALSHDNLKEFERLLAAKFHVSIEAADDGDAPQDGESLVTPDWQWLSASSYPFVDRRWVLYAISRVFAVEVDPADNGRLSLECILPESNVLVYLVVAGHLTVSNTLAAFRSELSDVTISKTALAEEIVQQLIEVDPALELLLSYLAATKLGEVELLLIIRTIMRSLDQQPRLAHSKEKSTEDEENVSMEIDELERELEKAEYNLGEESNTRARLLTAAFEGLAGYSSVATVRAMRVTLSPLEILSLIHLFRIQLVGSAWTTRYSELTGLDQDGAAKTMPDGAIALIAELLARCIDAVGTNGWLTSGSAGDQLDGGQFLSALKLEVNAALEGLNDAVLLNGILGEAVRFGAASLGNGSGRVAARSSTTDRPRQLEVAGSAELPLGLTPKQAVSQFKVVSGGEVVERSAREKGHLLSQRVKEYSLERISI